MNRYLLAAAVALISAAALAYEILLMRLFSIIQWHHFAYMLISVALLGFGASGSWLAIRAVHRRLAVGSFFFKHALLFAVTSIGAYLLVQSLPFNPQEVIWDARQLLWLSAAYLLLGIPFFFASNCICGVLMEHPQARAQFYAADLVGAGLGGFAVVAALWVMQPLTTLVCIGALGIVAAALVRAGDRRWCAALVTLLCGAAIAALLVPSELIQLRINPYKGLSQAMQVAGARLQLQRTSALAHLAVVASPQIPFRHAPGLSLHSSAEPPEQLGLFIDGDALTPISRYFPGADTLGFLEDMPSTLPYVVARDPRVLVLGAGGGMDVLQALHLGARRIDAVELNPQITSLVADTFAEFAGDLYSHPRVHVYQHEARRFVLPRNPVYDIVVVAAMDAFATASAGLQALGEQYAYTREAFGDYLGNLAPGGVVAITRWTRNPPRDGIKLFATAVAALGDEGVRDPATHLVWIRGWNVATLLVKNQPFTAVQIGEVRAFAQRQGFDINYVPGAQAGETNRHHILPKPYYFRAARALLGSRTSEFIQNYPFYVEPATDDRPFFFRFFKWSLLPLLLGDLRHGSLQLIDLGYPLIVATLMQAMIASSVLLLLPLWLSRNTLRTRNIGAGSLWPLALYFVSIGLGFIGIEIAFIQQHILYLGHPTYAAAAVLGGFLMFAGAGAAWLQRRQERTRSPSPHVVFAAIVVLGIISLLIGPLARELSQAATVPVRMGVSLLVLAPLAFAMGIPLPAALGQLSDRGLLAWAWGVNGCASVVGAVLATLLAIHFGATLLLILAIACYLIAAWSFPAAASNHRLSSP